VGQRAECTGDLVSAAHSVFQIIELLGKNALTRGSRFGIIYFNLYFQDSLDFLLKEISERAMDVSKGKWHSSGSSLFLLDGCINSIPHVRLGG